LVGRDLEQRLVHQQAELFVGHGVTGRRELVVIVLGQRDGGPGLTSAHPVEAGVDDDAVQPGGDGGVRSEAGGRAVGGEERILQGVRGLLGVTRGAQRDRPHPVAVAAYEFRECMGIACGMRTDQLNIGDMRSGAIAAPRPRHGLSPLAAR